MKKILQALDTASSKPVEGSNDMKKFVSIVQEGANPHKVALPVQMAMQHYQQPVVEKVITPTNNSTLKKYFKLAEDEINQRKDDRREKINQYASIIAERIRLREGLSTSTDIVPVDNPTDEVSIDIPLLIRLLEYAREDAQGDLDLHDVAERMIELSKEGRTLSMDDYNTICNTGDQELPRPKDNQED